MVYGWGSPRSYDRPRSSFQHALLLTLRDILGEKMANSNNEILCYAQDPAYTTTDEAILEEHGITVLDDPKAFLEVDGSTVVFSCAPNVPVKQIIADIARPAIVIWHRISETGPVHPKSVPGDPH